MDFESALIWHVSAVARLAKEAHDAANAAGENRRVYALDDLTQKVLDVFASYELRQPTEVIADAIEMYVEAKAAAGNPRAAMCLAHYGEKLGPNGPT